MKKIKILFLGAGNRLSLIEQFYRAAKERKLEVEIFSAESSLTVPIAYAAQILIAPSFKTGEFKSWLLNTVIKENINIVIPNMDSATVSLAELRDTLESMNIFAVVSSANICKIMEDKISSEKWFELHEIPVPHSKKYPLILKHRFGFGGKNQFIAQNESEKEEFLSKQIVSDYLIQEYISGPEYSVDAYVDRSGTLIGFVPRQRLKVVDGEVNESLTVRHEIIESMTKKLLSLNVGWHGPITIQYIHNPVDGCKIIEINPRIGGGATHSIHCGLDMPGWIIDEFLGIKLIPITTWKVDSLMTRCRKDIFHEHID